MHLYGDRFAGYFSLFFTSFMVKLIVWNCNGAASNRFHRSLKDLLLRERPDFLGFLETRCSTGTNTDAI